MSVFPNPAFLAMALSWLASPLFLWPIFFLAVIIFCAYSFVLFYHWREYGAGIYTGPLVSLVYVGVACMFLFVAGMVILNL